MKIKIEFDITNEAFYDTEQNLLPAAVYRQVFQCARLTYDLLEDLPHAMNHEKLIRDINGNRIGTISIEET